MGVCRNSQTHPRKAARDAASSWNEITPLIDCSADYPAAGSAARVVGVS